jgi:AraC-like DNA-binding protein
LNVSELINSPAFRCITPGIETLPDNFSLPRHRHLRAYATVVLAGSFEESGYVGRVRATAGDVLIHPTLDCHANQMVSAGVKLLRLNWADTSGAGGLYRLNEVDALARTAEKDVGDAALLLEQALTKRSSPPPGKRNDWPDLLAADLAQNSSIEIGAWAEAKGLARETVSRGFAAAYGIAPAIFRAELRARAAWLRVTRGSDYLCTIAAETGFADQAHMTRWIHRLTGASPAVWRRELLSHKCPQPRSQRTSVSALRLGISH